MELQVGVAKINKYASAESGDTLEVIERPHGGLSVVLADGQRSGKSAKRISNMVVRKVIQHLSEGVRDGAAARAASDYLYAQRGGQVQSTLNIISVDLTSNTLVVTRNNPAPMLIFQNGIVETFDEDSNPVGIYRNTRPLIREIDIQPGVILVAYSDGMIHAGTRSNTQLDLPGLLLSYPETFTAQQIADDLIKQAIELDQNRPVDDISIVVVQVAENGQDQIRRMHVRLPL